MENKNSKQNYLTGAAILSISTILVKIIGMLYKIPLKRLIGDANFGYFNTAYDIYSVMLVVSVTGLPVAMSRLVSEAQALGNGRQVKRIYQTSLLAYLVLGTLGSGIMMLFPRWLASTVMHNPGAYYSILALSPAVLCICIASACRGFFQGQGNMKPTAISQVIEALCKLILGLSLAWLVLRNTGDGPKASGATILGVTVGSLLSAIYLVIARRRAARELDSMGGKVRSVQSTMKALLAIAAVSYTHLHADAAVVKAVPLFLQLHHLAAAEVLFHVEVLAEERRAAGKVGLDAGFGDGLGNGVAVVVHIRHRGRSEAQALRDGEQRRRLDAAVVHALLPREDVVIQPDGELAVVCICLLYTSFATS